MPDCAASLASIEAICGNAIAAGIKKTLYVCGVAEVSAIAAASGHIVSSNITMVASKVFRTWAITSVDQELTSKLEGDPPFGDVITTLKFRIPKLTGATSAIMNGLIGGDVIAITENLDGSKRILGEVNNGASFTFEEHTTDKNSYLVTLSWKSAKTPYFYTGTIAT